jgi:putative transposase
MDTFAATGKSVGFFEANKLLTKLKKEPHASFLNEVSSVPLQISLMNLQKGFDAYFGNRANYPKFKKKSNHQTSWYSKRGFCLDLKTQVLSIAKIGPVKVRWSRHIPSCPTTVVVTKSCSGRYYVTLTMRVDDCKPLPPSDLVVGIDLGVTNLATMSNGEIVSNPRHLKKREIRLKKLQRILSRKVNGSNRYEKQRVRIARLHEKISDSRKDFLDKLTTRIVKDNGTICIENLKVSGMAKNHRLSKAILDCSFGAMRTMLQYKSERMGRKLIVADTFYPSSKMCCNCGYRLKELKLSCREWVCPGCQSKHDRDINAAINLAKLAGEHPVTARGEDVSRLGAEAPKR